MSVELRPLGVACNIQCQYCYQNPVRDAGNVPRSYDLDKMKAAIEAEGGPFSLFGGEPLLVPIADLEELWSWGLERYGHNSLQTNGTLITDAAGYARSASFAKSVSPSAERTSTPTLNGARETSSRAAPK